MGKNGNEPDYIIGVDLGGTKIMAGVFDRKLNCLASAKKKTKSYKGPEAVIERIAECIREAVEERSISLKDVGAIGIGAPGSVDPDAGRVIFAPNLNWRDIPLRKQLESHVDVPVYLENDCNLATLGVHEVELGGKPKFMVGIFIGTGIGCGIIIDGRRYTGFNGTGGEIGHMVLDVNGPVCGCGNKGCFEALASRTAIFNQIIAGIKSGKEPLIEQMLGEDLEDLRSAKLRKAIEAGDKFVIKIIQEAARYTGIAVANVINLLNPEFVVLGGGLIEQVKEEMIGIIEETAKKYAMPGTLDKVSIQSSKLADDAGIVGGAVLARSILDQGAQGSRSRSAESSRSAA